MAASKDPEAPLVEHAEAMLELLEQYEARFRLKKRSIKELHLKEPHVNAPRLTEPLLRLQQKLTALRYLEGAPNELADEPEEPTRGPLTPRERNALAAGNFHLHARPPRPPHKRRSEFERLIGQSLSVEAAASLLDVNTSRIRQRLIEGSLYGFKHQGRWTLPRFQFSGRKVVTGLADVLPRLKELELHPVAVARWFSTPTPELALEDDEPRAPLDWLREGHPADTVKELLGTL